jgi:hypothetical protein
LTISEFTTELKQTSPSIVTLKANLFMSYCFSKSFSLKLMRLLIVEVVVLMTVLLLQI